MNQIDDIFGIPRVKSPSVLTSLNEIEEYDEQVIQFSDDPIALACASARTSAEHSTVYLSLESVQITEEDRIQASLIRRYYQNRYAMLILRGEEISEFRKKVYGLMTGDTRLKRKELGLLYKLPHFYAEDQQLEDLAKGDFAKITQESRTGELLMFLSPKLHYISKRKHDESHNFWWVNNRNYLVHWRVLVNNPLAGLVKNLFDTHKEIRLQAFYSKGMRHMTSEFVYYRVANPRLVLNEDSFS